MCFSFSDLQLPVLDQVTRFVHLREPILESIILINDWEHQEAPLDNDIYSVKHFAWILIKRAIRQEVNKNFHDCCSMLISGTLPNIFISPTVFMEGSIYFKESSKLQQSISPLLTGDLVESIITHVLILSEQCLWLSFGKKKKNPRKAAPRTSCKKKTICG